MIEPTRLVSRRIDPGFFDPVEQTLVTWLGGAGVLINTRGTILLIDPMTAMDPKDAETVTEEWHHRLKFDLPLSSRDVARADAVLYTHIDGDHFGRETAASLEERLRPRFIAPPPVRQALIALGVDPQRAAVARESDAIAIGDVRICVTPAMHDWNAEHPFKRADCCGYVVRTPDGSIWHPGDTRIIEALLAVRDVDVLFFDLARARAHLGPEGSALLAETCGARLLVPYHYGTFDVAPGGPFGGEPNEYRHMTADLPARFQVVQPGELIRLPLNGGDRA